MEEDDPRVLGGRYRLTEPIGTGGAGTVWRGHDTVLERPVAVKVLRAGLRDSRRAIDQFRSEATAAAELTHPHTVLVYDVGVDEGSHYLVMELVEGPSLADLLAGRRPLPPAAAAVIGRDVADALGAAHDRGVIHRDIKPGNILITAEGVAKVVDFGVAQALDPAHTRLSSDDDGIIGSVPYLAPEQLDDRAVTPRSDVYSLGLVLHESLTGDPPFGEGTPSEIAARRLTSRLPGLDELRPDVPPALAEVIHTATSPDPGDRFPDGAALRVALQPLATQDGRADLRSRATGTVEPTGGDGDDTRVLPTLTDTTDAAGSTARRDRAEAPTRQLSRSAAAEPTGPRTTGAEAGVEAAGDGTPGGEPAGGEPADPDGSGGDHRRVWVALALTGLAAAVLAVLAATTGGGGGTGDGDGDPPAQPSPIAFQAAQDFDPFGDGSEHPDDLPKALDGDPGTAWVTERYNSADLGGLKPGVGLILDLGGAERLAHLRVQGRGGANLEIYAADEPPTGTDPAAWGTLAASAEGAAADAEIPVDLDRPARFWLLWITRLPGSGRAEIAEVAPVAG